SSSSTSPLWVADNGTGLSTLYNGQGQIVPLVVTIPPGAANAGSSGTPTGTGFNGTNEFQVSQNGVTAPAVVLFATEDGTISGWNPKVNATNAVMAVDQSDPANPDNGAVFKGLTAGVLPNGTTLLYATDFRHGNVEVFTPNFVGVQGLFAFRDPSLPP